MARIWSLAEANASLFRLEEMMREANREATRLQEAGAEMERLLKEWSDAVSMPDHSHHAFYATATEEFHGSRQRLGALLQGFAELDVEVKDIQGGLVDFRSEIGGKQVYLCWVVGEPEITHWHTLEGGFAGRKRIPNVETVSS